MIPPPAVGEWYRYSGPAAFHVTAIDERSGEVEIEYEDGTLDGWPIAQWRAMHPTRAEPPQDWTGPFDAVYAASDGNSDSEVNAALDLEPIEAAHDAADQALLEQLAEDLATLRQRPLARSGGR